MRVLIADGDETMLELASRYLSQRGYEVKAASDGLECADILCDFVPDVMVLDDGLLWGGSDGVIRLMHDHPNVSRTPMILIADDDPRDKFNDSANPTLVRWLRKPYRLSQLLTQIEIGSPSLLFAMHGQ